MNHIELFAGCGGLCLGLSSVGFKLVMANELSPMAAETFAFNILNEDLQAKSQLSKHSLWISSQFSREDMKKRLREDPRSYPSDLTVNSDLHGNGDNLQGSLVVGNILALNEWLNAHPIARAKLASAFGEGEVDLVSGGPPCQSFSLAGLREKNNEKNSLPWAFAKFAALIKPKIVLLENVTGILRPFTENGTQYHAWLEVSKAFAGINYVPLTLHINAKYAGVAQNRPRFILIGVRKDIYDQLKGTFNSYEEELFQSASDFFDLVNKGRPVNEKSLAVHDLNTEDEKVFKLFRESFLSSLCTHRNNFVSVREAIDDLSTEGKMPSVYVKQLNCAFNGELTSHKDTDWSHRITINQPRVRRRFRIYQVMSLLSKESRRDIGKVLSGKETGVSDAVWKEVKTHWFLSDDQNETKIRFTTKETFLSYLFLHLTKKQTQRALIAEDPAPAALSIPDDACHYKELRTLTAREMARIQSFPDKFVFRSKMTTGGQNRRFEVPIYTQIGNAVPVLLGRALGVCVKNLLERL